MSGFNYPCYSGEYPWKRNHKFKVLDLTVSLTNCATLNNSFHE